MADMNQLADVTIRLERPADHAAILRVAQRDSVPVPPAPRLLAVRDDAVEAVLSLRNAQVAADPFRATADLVELLRCRARDARAINGRHRGPGAPERPAIRPRLAGAGGTA
jgi:hypothetical protein